MTVFSDIWCGHTLLTYSLGKISLLRFLHRPDTLLGNEEPAENKIEDVSALRS